MAQLSLGNAFLLACGLALRCPALPPPGVEATLSFHVSSVQSGQATLTDAPQVSGCNNAAFAAQINSVLAAMGPKGTPLATFESTLQAQYRSLWQNPLSISAPSQPPGATSVVWTVRAATPAFFEALDVVVPTSALASGLVVNVTPAPAPPGSAPTDPLQRALYEQLVTHTTISLSGTGAQGVVANASTMATLTALARTMAASAALRYAQSLQTFRTALQQDLVHAQAAEPGLGPPYHLVCMTGASQGPAGAILSVTLNGLNPETGAMARVETVVLPNDGGAHPDRSRLESLYGHGAFTQSIESRMDALQEVLQHRLDALAWPRFFDSEQRLDLARGLSGAQADLFGTSPDLQEVGGTVVFPCVYLPRTTKLSASLAGDSVRSLAGSLTASQTPVWFPNDSASATFTPSTQGVEAGAHYTVPLATPLPWAIQASVGVGADDALERNQRLGTRSGPLVTLDTTTAGPTLVLSRSWTLGADTDPHPGMLEFRAQISPGYKRLGGHGDPALLGPNPSLSGFDADVSLAASLTSRPDALGHWEFTGLVEVSRWAVAKGPAIGSLSGSVFARRVFTLANGGAVYAEARAGFGSEGSAAPRTDLFRLGGDTWILGMQDGEVAGRRYTAAALEAGPNLQSLWNGFSSGTAVSDRLAALYLYGLAETAAVEDFGHAGDDFNPASHVRSCGIGLRDFDLIPNGSVALGYAWSPQAIRPSGRFFVSAVILFGN